MKTLAEFKHIHCIGIGGIGLSGIAEIFLTRGLKVSGSDIKESDLTGKLRSLGAQVFIGHSAENIEDADMVIYSAAVGAENPELKAAEESGVFTCSRAEALGMLMAEWETSIAISGTHGKTTTTSMISLILEKGGMDPTILVGGNLPEFNGNFKTGDSPYFVTEACEYMDSFLSLKPFMEIILNIDSDHLDYFKDIHHIVQSFRRFAELVPPEGYIIAYDANPFVKSVLPDLPCKVITFGFGDESDYAAKNIAFNALGMPSFDLYYQGENLCHLQLAIPGEHNIANALAAAACCRTLGVPVEAISATLETFTGTQRRFDVVGVTSNNIRIVDDYAHHPTEIKATLRAAANIPHNNLWCLFQPHTYTRTMALFDEFSEAFGDADKILVAEIYAAREKNIHKISSRELAAEIQKVNPGKLVCYFAELEELSSFVLNNASPDDLVITMGAGDIYKAAEMILEKDKAKNYK
ncbi:MAG: UDP-N-acetylmuramate--L-alanine ligase [Firmicutes bacterium]|nr:UDP-N-acetylmuramate--L-alanine ligase [Bacillota bacterium]